jgi:large subunit ribosomal protein L25
VRKDITVAAEVRTSRGKNEARRTRKAGLIPAVVYGAFQDPVAVAVSPKAINSIVHSSTGYNTIFNLAIGEGDLTPVMIVDHQVDPVKSNLLHADFKRIDLTKKIRVTVPVITVGESKGVKNQGGHLEIVNRTVEIECLPDDIPEHFEFDMTDVLVGQSRRASDIPLTGSMKLLSPPEELLAHVILLRAEAVVADAAAVVAEPEVVKKGKKEEAAPAAADKKKK